MSHSDIKKLHHFIKVTLYPLILQSSIFIQKDSASLFGKQHWVSGEYQTEVLNLIPKQLENRLATQRSCSFHDIYCFFLYVVQPRVIIGNHKWRHSTPYSFSLCLTSLLNPRNIFIAGSTPDGFTPNVTPTVDCCKACQSRNRWRHSTSSSLKKRKLSSEGNDLNIRLVWYSKG